MDAMGKYEDLLKRFSRRGEGSFEDAIALVRQQVRVEKKAEPIAIAMTFAFMERLLQIRDVLGPPWVASEVGHVEWLMDLAACHPELPLGAFGAAFPRLLTGDNQEEPDPIDYRGSSAFRRFEALLELESDPKVDGFEPSELESHLSDAGARSRLLRSAWACETIVLGDPGYDAPNAGDLLRRHRDHDNGRKRLDFADVFLRLHEARVEAEARTRWLEEQECAAREAFEKAVADRLEQMRIEAAPQRAPSECDSLAGGGDDLLRGDVDLIELLSRLGQAKSDGAI